MRNLIIYEPCEEISTLWERFFAPRYNVKCVNDPCLVEGVMRSVGVGPIVLIADVYQHLQVITFLNTLQQDANQTFTLDRTKFRVVLITAYIEEQTAGLLPDVLLDGLMQKPISLPEIKARVELEFSKFNDRSYSQVA